MFVRKSPITRVKRALSVHLPANTCLRMRITAPMRTTALRVLYSDDAAYDYVVANGVWFRLAGSSADSLGDVSLGVSAKSNPESVAVLIAGDIAEWHRRIAHPLAFDPTISAPTRNERAESQRRIEEVMTFLSAVARGATSLGDEATKTADAVWNRIDDQVMDSQGQHGSLSHSVRESS